MPSYWYHFGACKGDPFLQSICTDKRPYFMIYARDDYRAKYNKYMANTDERCMVNLGLSLDDLIKKANDSPTLLTPQEEHFLNWYYRRLPFGIGPCAMNRICWHIEEEFAGYKIQLKRNSDFNYEDIKVKRRCTDEHREKLADLIDRYTKQVAAYKKEAANPENDMGDSHSKTVGRQLMAARYRKYAKKICPNDDERLNIVLDLCYGKNQNKMFCWDVIGDLICSRLEELLYLEGGDDYDNI